MAKDGPAKGLNTYKKWCFLYIFVHGRQDGPSWAKDGPKMAPRWQKMLPEAAQDIQKMDYRWPKMDQDGFTW